jgi:S1-C subfamily serine protease
MAPSRLPPDFPFLLVTADGAFARGNLRGSHRPWINDEPRLGRRVVVRCLDEAVLSVVATDLGAPWVDADGRITGLLVGADVGTPRADPGDEVRMRPEVTAAYAVPADVIRVVWPLLKVHRTVPRGVLGVRVKSLSEAARQHLCPGCGGFEVLDLAPGGAAQRGGVEIRDVIRSVGGRKMAPEADLGDVLLPHRPGTRLRIGLLRKGEPVEVEVVLGRAD